MATVDAISLEPVLRAILREIEPTPTEKQGARRSHAYLREVLNSGKMEARIRTSYLSGSYARDTAVNPLDDVDIIFVIEPAKWPIGFLSTRPSPKAVLRTFAAAIRRRYKDSSVRTQRRSVRLQLYHLDIDVVPAIEPSDSTEMIEVADREEDTWIKSSPKRHSDVAASVNQARGGRFKPLVKLLKSWNGGLTSTARFKSFAVETMAVRLFGAEPLPDLTDGLVSFFDFVAFIGGEPTTRRWSQKHDMSLGFWGCKVPDTAGTGSNVVAGVDGERRKKFVAQAIRARDLVIEAGHRRSPDSAAECVRRALKAW